MCRRSNTTMFNRHILRLTWDADLQVKSNLQYHTVHEVVPYLQSPCHRDPYPWRKRKPAKSIFLTFFLAGDLKENDIWKRFDQEIGSPMTWQSNLSIFWWNSGIRAHLLESTEPTSNIRHCHPPKQAHSRNLSISYFQLPIKLLQQDLLELNLIPMIVPIWTLQFCLKAWK